MTFNSVLQLGSVPVETVEHSADLRLRAKGRTFPGTLLKLSNYMLELIYGNSVDNVVVIHSVVRFKAVENCVARFLNDVLFQGESNNLALRVRIITLSKNRLKWEGIGEKINEVKHSGSFLVKAATYDRIIVSMDPPYVEITLDI